MDHLGNTLSTISEISIVDHTVNDLYMRTNCLMADFSFTDGNTLSRVFNLIAHSFMAVLCGNISINNYSNYFILHGGNFLREVGKFLILHIMSKCHTCIILVFDVNLRKAFHYISLTNAQ